MGRVPRPVRALLTRVATLSITGGARSSRGTIVRSPGTRRHHRETGPDDIKAGQMMSVRPDVLPQAALDELAVLQDAVKPFETAVAIATIEKEPAAPSDSSSTRSRRPVAARCRAGVPRASRRHRHLRRGQGAEAGDPQHREQGPVRAAQGGGGVPGSHRALRPSRGRLRRAAQRGRGLLHRARLSQRGVQPAEAAGPRWTRRR